MNIDINYFNPANMRPGSVVLIVGRRGSGKSTLAKDIMSFQRHCKRGICVSATEKANPFWKDCIPSCFIRNEYSDSVTKELFNMQKKVKKKLGYLEDAFAIYDDCMFDRSFMKSKLTRRVFMNGRHQRIFTLVTAQWIMDVPPDLRANVDYTIVLRDNIRANRERVYKYFAGMFPTFAAFDEVMQQCTQDREALVIDQGCLSYNISDSIFFYRATPDLKFRICSDEYWDFSKGKGAFRPGGGGGGDSDDDDDSDGPAAGREYVNVRKKYPQAAPDHDVSPPRLTENGGATGGYGKRYRSLLDRSRYSGR